jgi:hypothetical protein
MKNKKEFFDEIIPIGGDCSIGEAISHFKYRKCSYPLDWNVCTIDFVKEYFESKFNCLETFIENSEPISRVGIMGVKDYIYFQHDSRHKISKGMINKYRKRNLRLNNLLESDSKILFVRKWPSDTVSDMIELKAIINSVYPNLKFKILIVNNIKDEIVNDKSIIHHYCDSDCFLKKSESDTFHHTSAAKSYKCMRESISQFDSNKYKQPKNIRIV